MKWHPTYGSSTDSGDRKCRDWASNNEKTGAPKCQKERLQMLWSLKTGQILSIPVEPELLLTVDCWLLKSGSKNWRGSWVLTVDSILGPTMLAELISPDRKTLAERHWRDRSTVTGVDWYHVRSITLIPVGAGSPIIFAKNGQSQKPAPAIVLWAIDRTWYEEKTLYFWFLFKSQFPVHPPHPGIGRTIRTSAWPPIALKSIRN